MTERDSTSSIDSSINCDVCNKSSGYSDNREPWDCGPNNPKPTWRCDDCIKAILDATEQRHTIYSKIKFDSKEQQSAWYKRIKASGFNELNIGPTINIEEVKRRKFKIND